MPKQGHFAKSTRQHKINQFKVKRHANLAQIDPNQFTDFLVVRFALTTKKHLQGVSAETNQRFLMELTDHLHVGINDLTAVVKTTLQELQSRVPWQFDQQITASWDLLQAFLLKEVPAVPLEQPVRLVNPLTTDQLNDLIAQLLANQATAITFLQRPVSDALRQQTSRKLEAVICPGNHIAWQQVAALLAPFPFTIDDQLDAGTQKWLRELTTTE